MNLVDVVLSGTGFTIKDVKRSPVTKKLLIHIDDRHCMDLSKLKPDKVWTWGTSNTICHTKEGTLYYKFIMVRYWKYFSGKDDMHRYRRPSSWRDCDSKR